MIITILSPCFVTGGSRDLAGRNLVLPVGLVDSPPQSPAVVGPHAVIAIAQAANHDGTGILLCEVSDGFGFGLSGNP